MDNKKILILGVGNTLLSDDGFGVRAIEFLANNYTWPENISLVDGGTRGLLLMSELMECDLAVILDIFLNDHKPGTCYSFSADEMEKGSFSKRTAHQTGVSDILMCCELAGHKPETIIIGFEPFDCQTVSAELSAEACKLLPEYCKKVIRELESRGLSNIKTKS